MECSHLHFIKQQCFFFLEEWLLLHSNFESEFKGTEYNFFSVALQEMSCTPLQKQHRLIFLLKKCYMLYRNKRITFVARRPLHTTGLGCPSRTKRVPFNVKMNLTMQLSAPYLPFTQAGTPEMLWSSCGKCGPCTWCIHGSTFIKTSHSFLL